MKEAVKFLTENPVRYLASIRRDGKAKCRSLYVLQEPQKREGLHDTDTTT